MVTASRKRGTTLLEMMIAISILTLVFGGFTSIHWMEARSARGGYYRAVAMEIVDGEMEALAAGEWKKFKTGEHEYVPAAQSAESLPEGRFVLTVTPEWVRLEWRPAKPTSAGKVVREAAIAAGTGENSGSDGGGVK